MIYRTKSLVSKIHGMSGTGFKAIRIISLIEISPVKVIISQIAVNLMDHLAEYEISRTISQKRNKQHN